MLLDIVDRNDVVLEQTTYDDVVKNNKIIRVVHNWVINSEGQILFQFRAAHKQSMPRRFDASVGGRVDAGETYMQAVVRETQEELGISCEPKNIGKFFMDVPYELKFIDTFVTYHDGPFEGWQEEAEAIEWLSIDEAKMMMQKFPYLFCTLGTFDLLLDFLDAQS